MKKEKRLNHAKHNEDVCALIHESGNFPDWVITTSFYSAIHYVSYKIFPLKITDSNGAALEFENLDYYYSYMDLAKRRTSKHSALSDLVYEKFPNISADYDWLFDLCHKSRYQNYQQSQKDAVRALSLLKKIKIELGIETLPV